MMFTIQVLDSSGEEAQVSHHDVTEAKARELLDVVAGQWPGGYMAELHGGGEYLHRSGRSKSLIKARRGSP